MLVLTRKKNESIVIRDDIFITIVEVLGNTVRIGVEAPKEVPIDRDEIARRKAASAASRKSQGEKPPTKTKPPTKKLKGGKGYR